MNVLKKGDRFFLSGVISENSDFSLFLKESAPLKLDFSGVQRVNSIGVRSWMRFLTQWNDKPLEYHECSIVVVDQLSIIGSLRGIRAKIATIQSAFLPTECTSCSREGEVRVTRDEFLQDPTLAAHLVSCPSCGGKVNFLIADFANLFRP